MRQIGDLPPLDQDPLLVDAFRLRPRTDQGRIAAPFLASLIEDAVGSQAHGELLAAGIEEFRLSMHGLSSSLFPGWQDK